MIGSNSIGPLSRATGDEQLVKTQRAGDKKRNQKDNERKKNKRDDATDGSGRGTEAVVVDIEFSEAVAQVDLEDGAIGKVTTGPIPGGGKTEAESESVKLTTAQAKKQRDRHKNGATHHIDVTG